MIKKIENKTHLNLVEGLDNSLKNWSSLSIEKQNNILTIICNSLEEQSYPFYESNSRAILVYKGEARRVLLQSDITGWTDPIEFKKLTSINLFFLTLELEPDARIEYHLVVDRNAICDPSNKFKSLNGLGALSVLAMPKYERHSYHNDYLYDREGSYNGLIRHTLRAGVLPYEHEVHVYLPPGYNISNRYPTIYFHDGTDYIKYGLAAYSINRLIIEKKIEPCIAVFVTPPNLHQPSEPNRSTEYGMNDEYVKFFCEELVTFIDNKYSTLRSPQKRIVIGDSYAGLISLYIVFSRTDVFAQAYSQSGYFSFNDNSLIRLFNENPQKQIRLYIDVGYYEKIVGADFLPSTERDFTIANRRMNDVLLKKNYDFIYREYNEGHTWGNWRRHLIDVFIYFYGI